MRFLSIFKGVETNTPPSPEFVARMDKLISESKAAGTLLATEGCLPTAFGARVRRSGRTTKVIDGPFTESKEVIAGFAILQANSREEAVEMTKQFLDIAGDGECEIRQIFEAGVEGVEGCHQAEPQFNEH